MKRNLAAASSSDDNKSGDSSESAIFTAATDISSSLSTDAASDASIPPLKKKKSVPFRLKWSKEEWQRKYDDLLASLPNDVAFDELTPEILPSWIPKRSIHWIIERQKQEVNPGVSRWLKCRSLMRSLLFDHRFHSLSSHAKMKKEMSEATAQLQTMESLLRNIPLVQSQNDCSLSLLNRVEQCKGKNLLILDICSGKGFLSCLTHFTLPQSKTILCDKAKMNLSHIEAMSNVHFHKLNILEPKFNLSTWIQTQIEDWIQELSDDRTTDSSSSSLSKDERLIVMVTGMHLCGELSITLIDAFNQICVDSPQCSEIGWCFLLLVPCCLPKKDHSVVEEARQKGVDAFPLWCDRLKEKLQIHNCEEGGIKQSVQVITQSDTLSVRDSCIIATKHLI